MLNLGLWSGVSLGLELGLEFWSVKCVIGPRRTSAPALENYWGVQRRTLQGVLHYAIHFL